MSQQDISPQLDTQALAALATDIKQWGQALGFQAVGIAGIDLGEHESHFLRWLENGFHGDMDYMARHGTKRTRPNELLPGTVRVICARMDYLPAENPGMSLLGQPEKAYISRYAMGRDYHKVIRKKLTQLGEKISTAVNAHGFRAFVDSAPVLEKALAEQAGLGWIGKHTVLLDRNAGSWFFLGEIYTDLPLPIDTPVSAHCGRCQACIDICPTRAIVAPWQLDARLCISYLTIELRGSIPIELRPLIGNRVFGCDDCQLVCPWNRFARTTTETDFAERHGLGNAELLVLFLWEENEYLQRTEGSPLRRIGYEGWLRNLAVGLGNGPTTPAVLDALRQRLNHPSAMVQEHIHWALQRLERAAS